VHLTPVEDLAKETLASLGAGTRFAPAACAVLAGSAGVVVLVRAPFAHGADNVRQDMGRQHLSSKGSKTAVC